MFFADFGSTAQQITSATLRQQPDTASDQDIELMRKDIRAQKKQIVAANLPLTPDESVEILAGIRAVHDGDNQGQ
jgi:hypothetical protein